MTSRHLSDAGAIEVVELLCLATESCRTADSVVSAALARVGGVGSPTAELGHDAARLVAMLSGASLSARATGATR